MRSMKGIGVAAGILGAVPAALLLYQVTERIWFGWFENILLVVTIILLAFAVGYANWEEKEED